MIQRKIYLSFDAGLLWDLTGDERKRKKLDCYSLYMHHSAISSPTLHLLHWRSCWREEIIILIFLIALVRSLRWWYSLRICLKVGMGRCWKLDNNNCQSLLFENPLPHQLKMAQVFVCHLQFHLYTHYWSVSRPAVTINLFPALPIVFRAQQAVGKGNVSISTL